MTRDALIAELSELILAVRRPHPVRVGIDGVDAAGKTTLAGELAAEIIGRGRSVIQASVDHFHHPANIRKARGDESPEGYYRDSFDYPELITRLLEPLGPGGSRQYRTQAFDHREDMPVRQSVRTSEPDAILLFEGVFLHRPELRSHWDLSIFLEASFETTVARAERRDQGQLGGSAAVRTRYQRRYVPGQRLYLTECRPWELATVVVHNDDPADPRLASEGSNRPARSVKNAGSIC